LTCERKDSEKRTGVFFAISPPTIVGVDISKRILQTAPRFQAGALKNFANKRQNESWPPRMILSWPAKKAEPLPMTVSNEFFLLNIPRKWLTLFTVIY